MSEQKFLKNCRAYRTKNYQFVGLQTEGSQVRYLFCGESGPVVERQPIEDGAVHSIAHIFPLADFAERQMYRDCRIKAIGNINLMPRED